MGFWNLINYLTDMSWSDPCIMVQEVEFGPVKCTCYSAFQRASKEIWLILIGVYGGIVHGLRGEWLILIWPMWSYNILYFNKLVFVGMGLG